MGLPFALRAGRHILFLGLLWSVVCSVSATSHLPCQRIDAAVKWTSDANRTYFFSQDQYMVYSDQYDAEENVFPMSEIARDFPTNIDAAVEWFDRGRSLYFKGCFFYKLNERRKTLRRRKLRRLRLPCDMDAAVNVGPEILFFKGCSFWRLRRQDRRASAGGNNSDLGLPCRVHAALAWRNGTVHVIKDDVIWTPASEDSPARSVHIDAWSLCSWNICEGNSTTAQVSEALQENVTCNGDQRFCSLRFDQVTMAGSHNAGSGFDGKSFMLFGCWVRNHYLSILEQLRLGIRYLDVDPSWEHCGLLGTFHNFVCGGPICRMLKQIKQFLRENRHEVVAITFNHEMTDPERVLPALVRQVTSQLYPYLNSYHRTVGQWPTLGYAVRSNKRLFVIIDERVEHMTSYSSHRWIHSERMLRSTWRADVTVAEDCASVLHTARRECERKADASLLEIAIFGTSTSCVTTIADLCLPLVHNVSRECGQKRHARGKAPNVLLVDFPERAPSDAESVTRAAYFQNIRNLARLTQSVCHVRLDAAVTWYENGTELVVIFSGPRVVVINWEKRLQVAVRTTVDVMGAGQADAAFRSTDGRQWCASTGCDLYCRETNGQDRVHSSLPLLGLPCDLDAAVTRQSDTYFFKGCQYWQRSQDGQMTGPQPVTDLSLPCDISAALQAPDGNTYIFKGEDYRALSDVGRVSTTNNVLDWPADFLHCQ